MPAEYRDYTLSLSVETKVVAKVAVVGSRSFKSKGVVVASETITIVVVVLILVIAEVTVETVTILAGPASSSCSNITSSGSNRGDKMC